MDATRTQPLPANWHWSMDLAAEKLPTHDHMAGSTAGGASSVDVTQRLPVVG